MPHGGRPLRWAQQQKGDRRQYSRQQGVATEDVDIGEDRRLLVDDLPDHSKDLAQRGMRHALPTQKRGDVLDRRLIGGRCRHKVARQIGLMQVASTSMVPATETPMLPPRLRETLMSYEASLVLSGGSPA